jgi:hypothetical protein
MKPMQHDVSESAEFGNLPKPPSDDFYDELEKLMKNHPKDFGFARIFGHNPSTPKVR